MEDPCAWQRLNHGFSRRGGIGLEQVKRLRAHFSGSETDLPRA